MTITHETFAWRALPVPLMAHNDPRLSRLIYGRIVRGIVIRWSSKRGTWATHWGVIPVENQR